MHTLIVQYLPRGNQSRTRRLVSALRSCCGDGHVETLDLALTPPRALDATTLQAYVRRNYAGQSLTDAEMQSLAEADALAGQLLRADVVVLAFPMFNFSVPAAVKAWLDAVMQKGRTWTTEGGRYRGLMRGRRALVLTTSGNGYEGPRAPYDHAGPLARQAFEFMGFSDVRLVTAGGLNADPAGAEVRLEDAEKEVRRITREWFAPALVPAG